jgi:hypothetical protein
LDFCIPWRKKKDFIDIGVLIKVKGGTGKNYWG